MKKRFTAFSLVAIALLMLCSCGESPYLAVKEDVICIKVDETYTINVEQSDNEPVKWSSGDSAIATVSPEGTVTGVGSGTTTIRLKAGDSYAYVGVLVESDDGYFDEQGNYIPAYNQQSDITEIEVGVKAGGKGDVTLNVGEVYQLKAYITPSDSKDTVAHWKSADESIAKVDENGKVTVMKSGKTTVSAYAPNGVKGDIILRCK